MILKLLPHILPLFLLSFPLSPFFHPYSLYFLALSIEVQVIHSTICGKQDLKNGDEQTHSDLPEAG